MRLVILLSVFVITGCAQVQSPSLPADRTSVGAQAYWRCVAQTAGVAEHRQRAIDECIQRTAKTTDDSR